MKPSLLVISVFNRKPCFDYIFQLLGEKFTTTLIKLNKKTNERMLEKVYKENQASDFDFIFLDLPHSMVRNEYKTISQHVEKTTLYEEDACQNYIPDSRWFGDFSYLYKKLGAIKVINTGFAVSQQLKKEGINSIFIPKGYNETIISDLGHPRHIDVGFIGTVRSNTYHQRYRILRQMELFTQLKTLRTNPGHEYNEALNSIEIFFSADCGLGEYMAKNFEAMAAGCLLIAYQQGNGEEGALGLADGHNVLLYTDCHEAIKKIQWANENPKEAKAIAAAGQLHAQSNLSFAVLSEKLTTSILFN